MLCPLCGSSAECVIGTFYMCSGPRTCRNSKTKPAPVQDPIPEDMNTEWRRIRYYVATCTYVDEINLLPPGAPMSESVVADSASTIMFKHPSDTYSWEEFQSGKPSMSPLASGTYLVYPPRYYPSNYSSILINHPQKKVAFFKI